MIKSFTLAIDVYRPSLNSDPVLVVVDVEGADYRVYQLGEGWLDEPVGLLLVALDEVIEDWGETPDAIETDHSITFAHPDFTRWLEAKGIALRLRPANRLVESIVRQLVTVEG